MIRSWESYGEAPEGYVLLPDAPWLLANYAMIDGEAAAERLLTALAVVRLGAWTWNTITGEWERAPVGRWRAAKRNRTLLPATIFDIIEEAAFRGWMEAGMPTSWPPRDQPVDDEPLPDRTADETLPDPHRIDDDEPVRMLDEIKTDDPPVRRASTAAAVTDARNYLVSLMLAGPRQTSKPNYYLACLARRPDLAERGFRTAWDDAIKATDGQRDPSWTKPGPLRGRGSRRRSHRG
jgi:hypothetical protein